METEHKRKFIIDTVYFLILAAAFLLLFTYVLPKLTPFVFGFIISYILRRPTRKLCKKFNLPHTPVALIMVVIFYCTVGLLITLLSLKAFDFVAVALNSIPEFYGTYLVPAFMDLFADLEALALRMDLSLVTLIQEFDEQFLSWLGNLVSSLSGWAVEAASGLVTAVPGLFLELVLMIISTFFISADYNILRDFCRRQMNEKTTILFDQVKDYLIGTLFVCIRSYAIIITLTFIELSIGLTLIGIEHATLIAAAIAIFDILPVLGTGGIMIPWGIFALIQGDFFTGLALLLLYVVITVIRNIVEPKIVGKQLGLHPVVTLASMFAGVQLGGVVGLFGAPIGLSLLRYLNENGSIHILKFEKEHTQ